MRLKQIRIAGFKSFVDPLTVSFPSQLVAVVGPNGCGKSNIIDAVRWVMGEASAKQLRSESMADVIFNGSGQRKPVGQAAVELIFDNQEGRLGGEYAQYNQISVRREVSRDGQSDYFLNGTGCRRRDITDLFLGTGLGARSYAIIKQDMIAKIVEAKPDELRDYLEEAAGISKYKERRRETENRMRHTRENLTRLQDVREELLKQLSHLKRQSEAAERYQILQAEKNQLQGEFLALQWRELDAEQQVYTDKIQENTLTQTAMQTDATGIGAEVEMLSLQQQEVEQRLNEMQEQYYQLGNAITRSEQQLQHQQNQIRQFNRELEQARNDQILIQEQMTSDETQGNSWSQEFDAVSPRAANAELEQEVAKNKLAAIESELSQWQQTWQQHQTEQAQLMQKAEVGKTKLAHTEQQLLELQKREQLLTQELAELEPSDEHGSIELMQAEQLELQARLEETRDQQAELQLKLTTIREQNREASVELDSCKTRLSKQQGRQSSLEALQEASLGKSKLQVVEWLREMSLQDYPRLGQDLVVESGWEHAVEVVLGEQLQAVCINDWETKTEQMEKFPACNLMLMNAHFTPEAQSETALTGYARLVDKIKTPFPILHLLAGIFCVENEFEARKLLPKLAPHESVVTLSGIWLSPAWVKVREAEETAGIIQRQQELQTLSLEIESQKQQRDSLAAQIEQNRERILDAEDERDTRQRQINVVSSQISEVKARMQVAQEKLRQKNQRFQQLSQEIAGIQAKAQDIKQQHSVIKEDWQQALTGLEILAQAHDSLQQQGRDMQETRSQVRVQADQISKEAYALGLQVQTLRSQIASVQDAYSRGKNRLTEIQNRIQQIEASLLVSHEPIEDWQEELETHLAKRLGLERTLHELREQNQHYNELLENHEEQKDKITNQLTALQQALTQLRLDHNTVHVRQQTVAEQMVVAQFELAAILNTLQAADESASWQEKLEYKERQIVRLGAINLAAIEEYKEVLERSQYLEIQNADLQSALATLEAAIQKIDTETKTKFQDTFQKVNQDFQKLFPKVFGGGHAQLDLTGDDWLTAGVEVIARPPGKRNATIHMLSGGEKALTALSLVFAIFQLNPAPFCMLDEVDAPLDEANVGRYCQLVKEMSDRVQFIFVTHNKVTMQLAQHLIGVTMREAGVSRLVSVDVEQAMALAEA